MRILFVNVPHPAIGSRIPREQLPPLGLLAVAGPLIDDGHDVELLDGELGPVSLGDLVDEVVARSPDLVMFGHSGSSSGQPIVSEVARRVRAALPRARIVYGGVHPTYFWRELLAADPWVDVIVRGEGEETGRRLVRALVAGEPLTAVPGLAFREEDRPFATPPAPVIQNLDDYRVGWELIDHARYGYWGGKRAVVIQFSRGCPHLCNYCGQRGFWTRWRHRDPEKLADEIAWLHREHGVEVFNFADENPSAGRKPWLAFLRAIIARNLDVTLVGSTRAGDIVRDHAELHLYKQAGFERFLMGMESTDEPTLKLIRKGAAPSIDREAIRLLRQHRILSMATWVAGFDDQTDGDFWRGLRQLIAYDPDQVQMLYVTPHRWTPYYRLAENREVIQPDLRRWDYKHQVLAMKRMPAWRVLMWVKFMEVTCQVRPRALMRLIWRPDAKIRHATRWYYRMGRRVWFHEIISFVFRDRRMSEGRTVAQHLGTRQDHEEEASAPPLRRTVRIPVRLDA
ncbi:MAG: magnesium-protoporphyrin IX monomethyl ester anaerobic oxidative cyclase [Alphaproteobacteria bacterium]|nr:magnesium-protoporphyrin IX monomethyl ester anaerobic oxidative cyclase [Alphaproteobacteria bacterium]MBU1526581.1 magnesium-protoporphyrin IX monomethyl ester anaerobic oxidative cyclase [Alphaproteobacteria bacterium]MBU2118159.1 magnesium-protoporphyrin IX monomethyl ester anaerobic oxidative cyclase [Alphaproteobacteria bacterium]MBU2351550.1 magnesium-protoporphyrin IX monomethyl ester anaerobic oxidative cyclase [Alphaproteobacteria bacterium]MBU2383171.1 magnesium-protoporphyrin IX 